AGKRVGDGDPSGPHREVRAGLARRPMPFRAAHLGEARSAALREWPLTACDASALHADCLAGASPRPALDVARGSARRNTPKPPGPACVRLPGDAWRPVLR